MYHRVLVSITCVIGAFSSLTAPSDLQRKTHTDLRIHKLEELTWPEIDALHRDRTLFVLPIGMVEQHGHHLPVGADTIAVTFEADLTSRAVKRALSDWNVVMMPTINYGHAGANQLGNRPIHPGTYAIRQSTLRAVVADVGGQIAQNGFKWIFVVNGHAAPTHNIAINEACDFVSESFEVTMLHLTGLFRADAAIQSRGNTMRAKYFTPAEVSSFGLDIHAGVGETSGMLAIRRDLVAPGYRTLPSRAGHSLEELREIATRSGWQGYFSSPARASVEYGRAVEAWWVDGFTDLIVRAVGGENLLLHRRLPETVPPAIEEPIETTLANETTFERKLENWLVRRKQP